MSIEYAAISGCQGGLDEKMGKFRSGGSYSGPAFSLQPATTRNPDTTNHNSTDHRTRHYYTASRPSGLSRT